MVGGSIPPPPPTTGFSVEAIEDGDDQLVAITISAADRSGTPRSRMSVPMARRLAQRLAAVCDLIEFPQKKADA